jgi:Flp pilus assembly protein TadG
MVRDPRGQSAVEALLGTILFVTLIFGGLELARAVALKQALDRGAFEGVRYLATHGDVAGTTPVVRAAVARAILGANPTQASVNTTWTAAARYGDSVCVTASYATTIDMPLVAAVARTLTATHCTPYEVYP